jgi:CRP-like cAMP-binding protein
MIFSGRAKVFSVEDDGEQIYAVLGKGDFFGEMSVLDQKPRSASVAAIDDCEVFVWDADSFLRMLQEYPSISIEFMRILSKRLRRANRRINNFSFMSARERLIVYLKEDLERRGEPRDDGSVLLPDFPSQSDLGSIVGSSRETVSRIFREFTHEGILKKIGYKKVLVLNEKLLQI